MINFFSHNIGQKLQIFQKRLKNIFLSLFILIFLVILILIGQKVGNKSVNLSSESFASYSYTPRREIHVIKW